MRDALKPAAIRKSSPSGGGGSPAGADGGGAAHPPQAAPSPPLRAVPPPKGEDFGSKSVGSQKISARPDPYASNADWAELGIPLPPKDANYDVVDVKVLGPLTLHICHADGVKGTVRFEETHLRGIFAPLRDLQFFKQVHAFEGAVRWPNDLDLAPDNMHRHLYAFGEWVLQ